jgi:hypothetical protein
MVLMDDASKPGFIISSLRYSSLRGSGGSGGRYCEILFGTAPPHPPNLSCNHQPTFLFRPVTWSLSVAWCILLYPWRWRCDQALNTWNCSCASAERHKDVWGMEGKHHASLTSALDVGEEINTEHWTLFIQEAIVAWGFSNFKLKE